MSNKQVSGGRKGGDGGEEPRKRRRGEVARGVQSRETEGGTGQSDRGWRRKDRKRKREEQKTSTMGEMRERGAACSLVAKIHDWTWKVGAAAVSSRHLLGP